MGNIYALFVCFLTYFQRPIIANMKCLVIKKDGEREACYLNRPDSSGSGVKCKISFGVQLKTLQSVLSVFKSVRCHLLFQQFAAFEGGNPVTFCN